MVRTRVAALAGVLALAAGLTAGLGAATTASAAATLTNAATSAGLQNFASNVETLGETRFPDTFAGAALTSAGVVIVYLTNTSDAALNSAITGRALQRDGAVQRRRLHQRQQPLELHRRLLCRREQVAQSVHADRRPLRSDNMVDASPGDGPHLFTLLEKSRSGRLSDH
jgi:hypothetical protein